MLFKTTDLQTLKGFDERFFLYMEDADICRRIYKSGKKILFYPKVEIIHQHQQGSSKSIKLFIIHASSAIKYFLKWGFN
jgi:GT2 family glycosyltransferase